MTNFYIDKKNNIIKIRFNDPLQSKTTKSNNYSIKNEKKALNVARTWDFNFYEKHNYLLPKGISLSKERKKFHLTVTVEKSQKKRKHIGVYNLLIDAIKAKKDIINSLF